MEKSFDTQEHILALLIRRWNELFLSLKSAFEKRETHQIGLPMEEGMKVFIEFLFLSNGKSVQQTSNLEMLDFFPVNLAERLHFIESRPSSYHSFIQLSELFREQEKLYAKNIALKKASKHKSV